MYGNSDILFSSLVGTKIAGSGNFGMVQNELMKRVLNVKPFLPFSEAAPRVREGKGANIESYETSISKTDSSISGKVWKSDERLDEAEQFFPFMFEALNGERYLLPYEPFVSISGKNNIVRRNVAKMQTNTGVDYVGSIKERWSRGDYEITITGALYGSILTGSVEDCFPKSDFEKLRDIMTTPRSIRVFCEPLQLLGINQIVIEDFSFPFSKGENVQAYEIKAYSDFPYKLLLDLND